MIGQKKNTNIDFNNIRKEDATRLGRSTVGPAEQLTFIIIPPSRPQSVRPGLLRQSGEDRSPSQCS